MCHICLAKSTCRIFNQHIRSCLRTFDIIQCTAENFKHIFNYYFFTFAGISATTNVYIYIATNAVLYELLVIKLTTRS